MTNANTTADVETDIGFESVTIDDYPDEKPHETFSITKDIDGDDLKVEIEFRDGGIHVEGSGIHSFRSRAHLDEEHDEPALDCRRVRLDGARRNLTLTIPPAVAARLHELQDEMDTWREKARKWLEAQPLRFLVAHHEYMIGWRTKYRRSAVVLKPNKRSQDMTDDERRLYEALQEVMGTADDYPALDEDVDHEVGDVLTEDEVTTPEIHAMREELAEAEREAERWQEIVADFPILRGVSISSEAVEETFREAERLGERQHVTTKTTRCSEPSYECNIDNVEIYATPGREIETRRRHMH